VENQEEAIQHKTTMRRKRNARSQQQQQQQDFYEKYEREKFICFCSTANSDTCT
jgi:hypothetical protein